MGPEKLVYVANMHKRRMPTAMSCMPLLPSRMVFYGNEICLNDSLCVKQRNMATAKLTPRKHMGNVPTVQRILWPSHEPLN